MSSEVAGCIGKERFETRDQAERVRKRMARNHSHGRHVGVYRCDYCGGWHIGSSNERKRRRRE